MSRRLPLLLSTLLLLSISVSAQQRFRPGIRAGISTSQVEGDTYAGFNKFGLDAGLMLNAKLNEKWSAQFELAFVQKGSKHNANPDQGDYRYYRMQLNYIEVPILVQYQLKKFTFDLGPGFGYLINHHEDDFWGPITNPEPFKSIEISASVGVSYTIYNNLGATWRYSNSLLPIRTFSNPGVAATYNPGQRNNVMSFTLTYIFGKNDAP